MAPRLLVLDWGIGGAGALARLQWTYPELSMVYWSDSGQTPYGRLPPEVLAARLERVIQYAVERWGVTHAFVACNAASTVLEDVYVSVPIAGMIKPAVAHLSALPAQTIGVIGGERTIESGAYTRPLLDAGHKVVGKATQPLSALIEAGEHVSAKPSTPIKPLLAGLQRVDVLALACTHYPAASEIIAAILPGVSLYDPLNSAMEWISRSWGRVLNTPTASLGKAVAPVAILDVVTTGDAAATARGARVAFGVHWEHVQVVTV